MKKFLFLVFFLFSIFPISGYPVFAATERLSNLAFEKLNIELTEGIARKYYTEDGILIRGRALDKNKYVLFFLKNIDTDEEIMESAETDTGGNFQIPVSLPKNEGKYMIILTSGLSFRTSITETIELVARNNISQKPISTLSIRPSIVYDDLPYLYFGSDSWGEMIIEQGKKTYKKGGKIIILNQIPIQYGNARVSVSGNSLSSPSSLDQILSDGFSWSGNIFIDRTRDLGGKNLVSLTSLRSIGKMQFRIKKGEKVKSEYFLTTPNGDVIEYHFPKNYIGSDGYLRTNIIIRQSFPISNSGVYKIETVRDNGIAYFNLPISKNLFWSIIEPVSDDLRKTLRNNKKIIDTSMIASINKLRTSLGRQVLVQDKNLMNLAQRKAEDMAKYNYMGHTTKDGLGILAFAKSQNIEISSKSIGENVAGGSVSDISLQDLLEESGSHRYNMVNPEWKSIGIGYILKDGQTYVVQIFGT